MRFVPIKTDDQLDLQAIHRVRDRLISRRTAVINQLQAFLLERGMVFAQKPAKLKAVMIDILESAKADLTSQMRNLIDMLWGKHNRGFGGEKRGSGDMSRNYRRQGLYTGNFLLWSGYVMRSQFA